MPKPRNRSSDAVCGRLPAEVRPRVRLSCWSSPKPGCPVERAVLQRDRTATGCVSLTWAAVF